MTKRHAYMTDPDPLVDRQPFKSLQRRGFAIFTSYNLNESLIPRNDDYFSKCSPFFLLATNLSTATGTESWRREFGIVYVLWPYIFGGRMVFKSL